MHAQSQVSPSENEAHDATSPSEQDTSPPQVRGIVRLTLSKSTRVKDISITLTGMTRTDWPEGLKQNGIEVIEQIEILRLKTSIFRSGEGTPLMPGTTPLEARHETAQPQPGRGTNTPRYMWPEEVREQSRERERPVIPNRPPPMPLRSVRGIIEGLRPTKTSSMTESTPMLEQNAASSSSSAPSSAVPAEWFELRKGQYDYPFSISLPRDLPPSLHADFGHVVYLLRATVFRSGPLVSNLTDQCEVTLVQIPMNDPTTASDSIVVNRTCDDLLSYAVSVDGHSFPIGTTIPMHLTMIPIGKTRVHCITCTLEEQTVYYANERKTMRQEKPHKWNFLRLQNASITDPLLPLMDGGEDALAASPLYPFIEAAARQHPSEEEEIRLAPLNPVGPWHLVMDLSVYMKRQKIINISCQHPKSNVAVHHTLKVILRVEQMPDDASANPRILDIAILIPIHITHSKTSCEWLRLPSYESSQPAPSYEMHSPEYRPHPSSPPPPL